MRISHNLKRRLASVLRGEEGGIAIETVIILPVLFIAFMAMFCAFDAYRQHAINQKAAYTIGDLISRQTTPMDTQFLNGARNLFDYLTRSSEESSIRITSVQWDDTSKTYKLDWSRSIGGMMAATKEEVLGWANKLPKMAPDEYITVVETSSEYDAPFDVGLQDHDITNYIFTRPRYAPSVRWKNS